MMLGVRRAGVTVAAGELQRVGLIVTRAATSPFWTLQGCESDRANAMKSPRKRLIAYLVRRPPPSPMHPHRCGWPLS